MSPTLWVALAIFCNLMAVIMQQWQIRIFRETLEIQRNDLEAECERISSLCRESYVQNQINRVVLLRMNQIDSKVNSDLAQKETVDDTRQPAA